ncbi:MAG TPA: hypothetical protein VFV32_06795 [Acidimicrobiales bacterium]|jgi:hypothetical protein|nr:hypothetical protein [Acidimicrobiales bacterium]
MTPPPDDVHEWVSFEDPTEDRTWVFDLTFLVSPWTCIYGRGCQGVLTGPAPELEQGCCSYGAHFVDEDDEAKVRGYVDRLTPEQWQLHEDGRRLGTTERDEGGDITTRLVDDACVFLNRPGFEGGAGCALHRAALEAGERPLDWKPAVCWQLPLRLEERTADDGHVTSTLREWKRRDWGEGGFEFHWWCTDDTAAFVDREPVYVTMRDEIVELVGPTAYDLLVEHLTTRQPPPQYLPHPALRRR